MVGLRLRILEGMRGKRLKTGLRCAKTLLFWCAANPPSFEGNAACVDRFEADCIIQPTGSKQVFHLLCSVYLIWCGHHKHISAVVGDRSDALVFSAWVLIVDTSPCAAFLKMQIKQQCERKPIIFMFIAAIFKTVRTRKNTTPTRRCLTVSHSFRPFSCSCQLSVLHRWTALIKIQIVHMMLQTWELQSPLREACVSVWMQSRWSQDTSKFACIHISFVFIVTVTRLAESFPTGASNTSRCWREFRGTLVSCKCFTSCSRSFKPVRALHGKDGD